MNFLEKDLEQIIFETPNKHLFDKGLLISGIKSRQVRVGNYGISDLITIDRPVICTEYKQRGLISVYELKQNKIGSSAFLQAVRYLKGIDSYLSKRGFNTELYDYGIVLIGSTLENGTAFSYLTDFMVHDICDEAFAPRLHLDVYTYKYDFDGISFVREDGYKLVDEGFGLVKNRKSLKTLF